MSDLKQFLRSAWFRLRGLAPEAVVVSFRTGDDRLARAMAAEAQRLLPDRVHYFVSVGQCDPPPGATLVVLRPGPAGDLWLQLRRAFLGIRIGMSPVLFDGPSSLAPLRCAAFLLAPGKVLAYNSRLERHHLQWNCPLASYLFWRGVPLDRIWLRPRFWPGRRDRTERPDEIRIVEGRPFSPARARIAVVSPYVPWPLSHGGAVRIYHLLREAALTHDIVLLAFVESETPEDLEPLRKLCAKLVLVAKPRYREPRWSTLQPPEVLEYQSLAMQKALAASLRDDRVQAVQIEYTQLASYIARDRGDILVEHDLTFDLYRQVLEREPTTAARWDWWRWHRFERRALRRAGRVVVMSAKDAALSGSTDAVIIPNGVDLGRFSPSPESPGWRLLFIGSFRHFPNVLAYRFLVEEVWPRVIDRFPDAELTAVAGPQPLLYWQAVTSQLAVSIPSRVRLLEYVDDVKPLYDQCNIVVVPTPVSAGTNVKVLEAMSMQRAVVSTTSGCAGLGLVHGHSVWVADDAAGFAEGVARLLDDRHLRGSIAEAARRNAELHFSWKRLGALQRRLWREVAPSPLRIRPAIQTDLAAIDAIQCDAREASQWEVASYLQYHCVVGELEGHVAGFLVFRNVAPGEHEILNLAVAGSRRRTGIAAQLLCHVLEQYFGEWFLEVRESNTAARKLYETLGFEEAGRRLGYYPDSLESGIVMRLRSC